MKTYRKTFAPEKILYKGDTYTMNGIISGSMKVSNTKPKDTIEALKSTGKKGILVEVLSSNLKGKTDLHGNQYKPSQFIYTN